MRDAIHISEETANLIKAAGKEHWIVPREDKVCSCTSFGSSDGALLSHLVLFFGVTDRSQRKG